MGQNWGQMEPIRVLPKLWTKGKSINAKMLKKSLNLKLAEEWVTMERRTTASHMGPQGL